MHFRETSVKIKAMFYVFNRFFNQNMYFDICSDRRSLRVPGRDSGTVF